MSVVAASAGESRDCKAEKTLSIVRAVHGSRPSHIGPNRAVTVHSEEYRNTRVCSEAAHR